MFSFLVHQFKKKKKKKKKNNNNNNRTRVKAPERSNRQKIEKEILEMFGIGKRVEESLKPRPVKRRQEDCKKLLADKLKEVTEKGGSKKWVIRIRGQPGAFHAIACRRRAVE